MVNYSIHNKEKNVEARGKRQTLLTADFSAAVGGVFKMLREHFLQANSLPALVC